MKLEPVQIAGVTKESVRIPVGDKYLYGWFFENHLSPYVVLVNHGNSGNISSVKWIANNLLTAGVSVLLYDYRGYGLSSRLNPDVDSICEDGNSAYRFLTEMKGYKPENIILYGQSLGCAVSCDISGHHKVKAMILQSGFSSLRNCAFQRFPILQHAPDLIPDSLDNCSILSKSNVPLLVIHGDKDKVVPFQNANQLYGAATGKKWLVVCHNSGHRLYPEADVQHRDAVHQFLQVVLSGQSSPDGGDAATAIPTLEVHEKATLNSPLDAQRL
jgi:pimeloyl-ACP methyl ester carboxylesterase